MPWLRSCLSRREKKKPKISPPLHLLLKGDEYFVRSSNVDREAVKPLKTAAVGKSGEGDIQSHCFRVKKFRKPRPCHVCHQPILNRGSVCRVCKYVCHHACETKIIKDELVSRYADTSLTIHQQLGEKNVRTFPSVAQVIEDNQKVTTVRQCQTLPTRRNHVSTNVVEKLVTSANNGSNTVRIQSTRQKPTQLMTASRPVPKFDRQLRETMDFTFVTERIIVLYFPENVTPQAFHQGHSQAAHLLTTKHANNYTVFNLTEPRRSARSQHARVRELNWTPGLAPPLDKLCSICKEIETWLNGDSHRVAVLHARGNRERIGVVVASFMHYSNICGTADQALDRFAMEKFLDDKIQELEQPSQRRYVDYFAGLLSGNLRINSAPLYLTHITVLGAPAFENSEGVVCRAFIKIYEGLMPVYTSGVHRITPGTRQFTVNVAGDRRNQGLQLRGDVLVKCYHKHPNQREVIFACQFHTCTITDYTLSFTRHELDSAAYDLRFPLDGAVEFHFSSTPSPRLPLPAPTPAVAIDTSDNPIVRWDSYADLNMAVVESDIDHHGESGREVAHTFGPLDGSIYATVAKKVSPVTAGATTISSPRTVSMDSGISSAGNGLLNNNSNASSSSPAAASNLDTQRAWDELLREMQITVESIPDTTTTTSYTRTSALPRSATYAGPPTVRTHTRQTVTTRSTLPATSGVSALDDLESVTYIDDPDEIPYHARQDSRPFTYGAAPGPEMLRGQPGLSSPSLVRKASFGKAANVFNGDHKYDKYEQNSWTMKNPKTENPWAARSWTTSTTPRYTRSWDTTDSNNYIWRQTSAPVTRKTFNFVESSPSNGLTNGSVTWLQRQQQKLRERREAALRMERRPQEVRLFSELKSQYHHRPMASHRDGYTSDTTHFADDDDDDDDLSIPLRVQTSPTRNVGVLGSAPVSPLPRRSYQNGITERPFVQVKRTHENRKYAIDSNSGSPTELGLLTLAKDDKSSKHPEDALTALISSLDRQRTSESYSRTYNHEVSNHSVLWSSQLRDDSLSSWRTASISDDPGSPSRTNSPRPVTPAFPVHPRTPYSNGSVVQFETNGLPPKSPTAQRRYISGVKSVRRSPSASSKDRSPSPSIESHIQYSPRSTVSSIANGGYQSHSQRSSIHSNSEPPQEVPPAHVKFAKDTSRYWYKPTISREEAINMLRNEPPGTFVVRDSNSFAGAFGLAIKVATPPPGKSGSGPDELVRHFLIEPTSRGVRLKGCANEPVFSSLSALVYQHSITKMALPTRLVLPEGERRVEHLNTSTAQQLLAQGAACNVLYLITVDMESLTGPQAIRKAINQLFLTKPLPVAVVVHFKVSGQGITLTDSKRQIFFRRHYPVAAISYCGLDPDDHRWSHTADSSGVPISSHRCFGFIARKPASKTDNQCHLFAELEPEQPATAIVNFVTKVMMTGNYRSNIV